MVLVCASLTWATVAWSEPKTAAEWFKEGSTQYNLGDFDKAAEAFKQAFTLETDEAKKPAYLYNVAQAYRQGQKCKDSVFFYRRFISLKDSGMGKPLTPETRQKTEELITEAEQCAKQAEATAKMRPDATMTPDGGTGSGTSPGTGSGSASGSGSVAVSGGGSGSGSVAGSGAGGASTTVASRDQGGNVTEGNELRNTAPAGTPQLFSARVLAGPAIIETGGLSIPVETTFTLVAGYPLPVRIAPQLRLEAGAVLTYTAVPFQNNQTLMKQQASLTSLLANAGVTYAVTPQIGARFDLGLGVLMLGGLSDYGSPFTQNGAPTSGALGMFALRASASVDYAITKNLVATCAPLTFSYSPSKTGLASDIKSFARIDVLFGVGYRM
jgi:hypothetical protein